MSIFVRNLLVAAAIFALCAVASGQATRRRPAATPTPKPTATPTPAPTPAAEDVPVSVKRNGRPSAEKPGDPALPAASSSKAVSTSPVYVYEFTRPGFTISKICIVHDDSGKGTITFDHKDSDETITDPIILSDVTMDLLRSSFAALDFLNSSEIYQHERDYSHLGNVSVTLKAGSRERTAAFNYTESKGAKAIGDEYQRIANQYTWMFNIKLARDNRPLDAPSLLETIDSYLRRKEISDPLQLVPFLAELSNDERLPLIARNHAARLVARIEKSKK